eukprot:TRINITY_DN94340_c0_g1_i1.p1 TRINITY_DN94340_c0_g1~~TRINITY_DN94340_c0_g1_i1.p1  ORF type:complete len:341 (+),score=35.93 TRINITY_DN94340_c0_g1_i1:87-1025(+)
MYMSLLVIIVTGAVSAIVTQKFVPSLTTPAKGSLTPAEFFRNYRAAFQHRTFRAFCAGFLLQGIGLGMSEALTVLFATYFWKFSSSQVALFPLSYPVVAVLAKLLVGPITRRFDKKPILLFALLTAVLVNQIPIILALIGWYPTATTPRLIISLIAYAIGAMMTVLAAVATISMLADIADQHELAEGVRHEGLFYAARTFFQKATGGFGNLLGGFVLDAIGLVPNTPPSEVPDKTITWLGIAGGPISGSITLLAIVAYAMYDLDEEKHRLLKEELMLKREQWRVASASRNSLGSRNSYRTIENKQMLGEAKV